MKKKADWKKEIDLVTEKFKNSFCDLIEEELNYKPKEEVWSIAQIIAHIITLNSSYFEYFREIQSGDHILPDIENKEVFAQNAGERMLPFMNRDRLEHANTWDIWEPPSDPIKKDIIHDFEKSQMEFKTLIENLGDLPLTNTYIKYPGHFDLIFKLDDCINFLIEHENRHWNQAIEIGQHS